MQAPSNGNGIKIPLNELLSILQKDGFEISTRTVLDIQKVLANLDDISKEDTANLKLLLGPLICRNKEEQERFYKLFDDYEKQLNEHSNLILNKFIQNKQTELKKEEGANKEKDDRIRKIKRIWIFSIIIGSLIIAAGIIYFIFHSRPPTIEAALPDIRITKEVKKADHQLVEARKKVSDKLPDYDIVVNDTVVFTANLYDTLPGHKYSVKWDILDSALFDSRSVNKIFNHDGHHLVKAYLIDDKKEIASDSYATEVLCMERPEIGIIRDSSAGKKQIVYEAMLIDKRTNIALDDIHKTRYAFKWYINDVEKPLQSRSTFLFDPPNLRSYVVKVQARDIISNCDTLGAVASLVEAPKLELKVAGTKPLVLNYKLNNNFLKLFLLISLLVGIGVYNFLYKKRIKKLKAKFFTKDPNASAKKKQPSEFSGPYSIGFKPQEIKIAHESAISQLAETLRKRHTSDTYYLNIYKTIRSSIRKAGFPVFEFTPRTQPADFLVFVDKEHPDSHLVKLYNYVLASLKNEQVNFTAYSYAHEPLLLSNESLNHLLLPIDKVARLYPGTVLFLFADTETFFKPLDNRLQTWATEKFKDWDSKIIFTSVAKRDWGSREMILYNAGFTVVPADINAHKVIADEINYMIDRQRLKKAIVPGAYAARHVNFNEWKGVKVYLQNAVNENNNELHLETDHKLMQDWVCATAVYPYVNWDATIAIGKALETKYAKEGELVNYTNLLVLSRIEWMKDGQMPDTLKIEMLKEMSNDKEITARKAVTDLLEEVGDSIPEDSAIFEEYQLQKTTNSFLVRQYTEGNVDSLDKDFMAVKEYLKNDRLDWATDIYLSDGNANPPIKQSKTDTRSVPIDEFITKKEKEGKEKDQEKQKQFRREKKQLQWKSSSIIGSIILVTLLSLLYGFKIKPLVLPAKADRIVNIISGDSMLNLATDHISVNVDGKDYKIEKLGDSVIKIKDLPTDTSFRGTLSVSSNNALTGQQDFRNTLNLGFENYTLTLGEPIALKPLTIFYSDGNEFNKIEGKLRTALNDFAITTSLYDDEINDTGFFLEYSDSALSARAGLMADQFKGISSLQFESRFVPQPGRISKLYLFFSAASPSLTCEEASLPAGLSEIWKGGSGSNRLININLDKQIIYYSTGDKSTYGTYRIREACAANDEQYRIITNANSQYKVFFIKDINRSAGFSLSVCQDLYPTIEEARKVTEANCDRFNTMNLYYENDPNKIFLPVSLNVLERRNQAKLNRISDSLNYYRKLGVKIDISGSLTYNSTFDWKIPDNLPVQIAQQTEMRGETPFDRTYIVYALKVDQPDRPIVGPDCNRSFNSMKEALSVDPKIVCRLVLKNQSLTTLPELSSFVNLQYLDVSDNYLDSKDSIELYKVFPKARIVFYKQKGSNEVPVAGPDCNRNFNSIREALSVDPKIVCRLILKNQNLKTLPGLSSFVNLQYLDVSDNYLDSKDSIELYKAFPKARIIFYKQRESNEVAERWQLLKQLSVDGNYRPDAAAQTYLKNLWELMYKNPKGRLRIVVFSNEIRGGERNANSMLKEIMLYLETANWNSLINSGRVTTEVLASRSVINAAYLENGELNYFYIYSQGLTGPVMMSKPPSKN
jgi:hypothetical protein